MVEVNANAVEACHDGFMQLQELRLDNYEVAAQAGSVDHRSSPFADLRHALQEELRMLDAATEFARLNAEGFRKILKKFDRRVGFGVSPRLLAWLARRSFAADARDPAGRCARARARLERLLSAAAADAPPPPPPPPPPYPGAA